MNSGPKSARPGAPPSRQAAIWNSLRRGLEPRTLLISLGVGVLSALGAVVMVSDITASYSLLAPLLVVILWLGLFPGPVLRRMEPSSRRFIELVRARAPEAPMVVPPTAPPQTREREAGVK